ncbi:hypothetical protein EG832_04280 [bacterium]|nr:hypothetical protein [bacterium]
MMYNLRHDPSPLRYVGQAYAVHGEIMGTERDTVYKGPCICGKGLFVVDYCNPDHGWPTSTPFWYETSITCQDCNKLYDLIEQGNAITIVEKKELARQNKLKEQWYRLREDIMRLPEVKEIVRDFVTLLKRQGTMAATHRLLKEAIDPAIKSLN